MVTIRWRNPGFGFDSPDLGDEEGDPFKELLVLIDPIDDGFWKLLQDTELTRRDSGRYEEAKDRLDERRRGRKGEVFEGNLEGENEEEEEEDGCRSQIGRAHV